MESKAFLFREIRPEEDDQAAQIEQICFPPNEACSEQMMKERVKRAPDLFLVAVDPDTGKLAGFLCGLSTMETKFRDEYFSDPSLYDPDGTNVMILGLDVLPAYRRQHLARHLVDLYKKREAAKGRRMLTLTCLEDKVAMYEKMGFVNRGISGSAWGGETWYEMTCSLQDKEEK